MPDRTSSSNPSNTPGMPAVLFLRTFDVVWTRALESRSPLSDHLPCERPERALEQLQGAENLLARFSWFTWVFQVRLKTEMASYWIARGDLRRAQLEALASLEIANRAVLRKHIAWGRTLIGDIAAMEDRTDAARQEYDAALRILEQYPCPTVEWRIRKARACLAQRLRDTSLADEQLARSRIVVQSLAESVRDPRLRRTLLQSAP